MYFITSQTHTKFLLPCNVECLPLCDQCIYIHGDCGKATVAEQPYSLKAEPKLRKMDWRRVIQGMFGDWLCLQFKKVPDYPTDSHRNIKVTLSGTEVLLLILGRKGVASHFSFIFHKKCFLPGTSEGRLCEDKPQGCGGQSCNSATSCLHLGAELSCMRVLVLLKNYWSIVNLQYCVSFRYTAKWLSYIYIYISGYFTL